MHNNETLVSENATLRAEVERLKEESSHLWVRIESGEAAAYEQGKAEARKQAAQEIIEEVIGDWNCDCRHGGLVIADVIKVKFGFGMSDTMKLLETVAVRLQPLVRKW